MTADDKLKSPQASAERPKQDQGAEKPKPPENLVIRGTRVPDAEKPLRTFIEKGRVKTKK